MQSIASPMSVQDALLDIVEERESCAARIPVTSFSSFRTARPLVCHLPRTGPCLGNLTVANLEQLEGTSSDGETAALAPRREVFFEMIGIVQHKLAVEPNRNSLSVDGDAQFVPTPFAFVKLPVEPIAVILAVPANSVRREDGSADA